MAMHGLADASGREVATCMGAKEAGLPFVRGGAGATKHSIAAQSIAKCVCSMYIKGQTGGGVGARLCAKEH